MSMLPTSRTPRRPVLNRRDADALHDEYDAADNRAARHRAASRQARTTRHKERGRVTAGDAA